MQLGGWVNFKLNILNSKSGCSSSMGGYFVERRCGEKEYIKAKLQTEQWEAKVWAISVQKGKATADFLEWRCQYSTAEVMRGWDCLGSHPVVPMASKEYMGDTGEPDSGPALLWASFPLLKRSEP